MRRCRYDLSSVRWSSWAQYHGIAVVKLADRLHNTRTLGSMPAAKQAKITNETLQV